MSDKASKKNDIKQIAADQGLHLWEIPKVINRIYLGMFEKHYRHNATEPWQVEFNERIKTAYKTHTGVEFDPAFFKKNNLKSVALFGPPGHGKTTAYKQAAKKFAKATGLTYIDRLDIADYVDTMDHKGVSHKAKKEFDRNCYLFVSQEFSGEVSKAGMALPFKSVGAISIAGETEQAPVEYMRNMMQGRFKMMKECMAGCLLLDDFVNASPSVQNIGLSVMDEGRYQDLDYGNVYIGLTGNLGSIDGTNTSRPSSALMNRVEVHLVADQPAEFAARLMARTSDKIGDLGMAGFLKRNIELFWKMPDKGSFQSPRAWDNAIDAMRSLVYSNGGSLKHSLDELRGVLSGFVGAYAAEATCDYLHQLTIGADPLARAMISSGKWDQSDERMFEERYANSGGHSGEALTFAYQFGTALADYAAQEIVLHPKQKEVDAIFKEMEAYRESVQGKNNAGTQAKLDAFEKQMSTLRMEIMDKTICNFVLGMTKLGEKDQVLALGVQQLCDKLAYQLPSWSVERTEDDRVVRGIVFPVKKDITDITKKLIDSGKNKEVDNGKLMTVINALTLQDFGGKKVASLKKSKK
jgi:hypothetical protein